MRKHEEFKDLKIIEDKHNPFCTLYELDDGSRFYLEPAFYTQMLGFKEKRETFFLINFKSLNKLFFNISNYYANFYF